MKNTILFSIVSAALLSTSAAFAGGGSISGSMFGGSSESSIADNIYLGGSIGQATTNCLIDDAIGTDVDCDMDGWKMFGGYRFHENFAIEGGYYNLGKTEESLTGVSIYDDKTGVTVNSMNTEGEASGYGLSGVALYEVVDNLEVFGKLGIMKYSSEGTLEATGTIDGSPIDKSRDASVDGTALLWGAGASYKVTDNIGIRGEYEGFTREDISGKDRDVSVLSAGLTFSTY